MGHGGNDEGIESDDPRGWVDRHRAKIVVVAGVFCAAVLLGRALSG